MHNLPIRILYRSPFPRSPQAFLPPPLLGDRNPSQAIEEQTLQAFRASPPIGRSAAGGEDLFSEAFVELQREIREESARGLDLNLNLAGSHYFRRRGGKGNYSRKSHDDSKNVEINNHMEFEDPLADLLDAGTPSHYERMLGMKGTRNSSAGNAKAGSSSTSMNGTDSNTRPKPAKKISNSPAAAARTRTKVVRQQREEDIAGEGGFIREAALPDKLRKFQENAAIDLDLNIGKIENWQWPIRSGWVSAAVPKHPAKYNYNNAASSKPSNPYDPTKRRNRTSTWNQVLNTTSPTRKHDEYGDGELNTAGTSTPSNPYNTTKRRNRTSTWNQVLNTTSPINGHDNDGDGDLSGRDQPNKKSKKTSWEEMEKQMIRNITSTSTSASCNSNDNNAVIASGPKCTSCASTNIESHGNITSRNNAVRKGEVWGMKDRGEMVMERYRCLNCGKFGMKNEDYCIIIVIHNRTSTWNQVLNTTSPTRKHDEYGDGELNGRDRRLGEEMDKQMIRNITSTSTSSSCNSNDNNAIVASGPKCTSCGSSKIESHGNITSRNNDVRKGEVWGMKDRGEMVVERYRCLNCGKVWNEE
eukprot:CAMPEP_0171354126 /NCGR_PEP_ID=MMETSP0878-20121228/44545_1 /TAXON_ID=67004 /ORGANISM="Thalassiosira weissflogii, Strain CCMP1336" /LENGTH=583 /DNA_ID=CAMNT_0011860089 /DNA_START=68 /DNA_END=1822 /DNA_ORIENTATION=+